MTPKEQLDLWLDTHYGPVVIAGRAYFASVILERVDPNLYDQLLRDGDWGAE